MPVSGEGVTILSEHECWDLLGSVPIGRLVTSVDARPEIFPVNFAVQRRTVLFRTAEGTKLISTAINNHVVFEADDYSLAEGWSVIVKGVARSVRDEQDLEEAERRSRCRGPRRRKRTTCGCFPNWSPAGGSGSPRSERDRQGWGTTLKVGTSVPRAQPGPVLE